MSLGLFKNVFTNHIYLIYMYKEDLAPTMVDMP